MGFYERKRVLITGGSSGIGRSLGLELASRGADVVLSGRSVPRLVEAVEEMRRAAGVGRDVGDRVLDYAAFDVTNDASVRNGVALATSKLRGRIDILVCCSGLCKCGPICDVPDDAFQSMLDVNYLGHVRVVRAAVPAMKEQGSGDVLLVSSMLGFFGIWGYGAYSASKYAISGFAECLRQEVMLDGVRVKIFYPPTTDTPGLQLENEDKPELTWAMEAENTFTSTYEAKQVARAMADCIPKRKFENVIGWDSWFVFTMYRWFPTLARWMCDGEFLAASKKTETRKEINGNLSQPATDKDKSI
uniref:3-dehydrosphinganine reductase n=1 Tax=Trieres chinensis TaxID=1514140 RepID=A0A7S2A4M3_TRICV|mmetsp:Transcript_39033/g.79589  ORF Transcript_39033/g.79589 Transcript_39033/m.79589 type:complete len:303 (+) Transcript_39033:68-976(+)